MGPKDSDDVKVIRTAVRADAFIINDLINWIRFDSVHHGTAALRGFEKMSRKVEIVE